MKHFLKTAPLLNAFGLSLTALAVLVAAGSRPADAQAITTFYSTIGMPETITAPFTSATGVSTSGLFTGPLEILVSGTGQSDGTFLNDAFYSLPGQTGHPTTPFAYQLGLGTNGLPFGADFQADDIQDDITFIAGAGKVSPGTVPAYNASNTYDFVIDVPDASPTPLTFGILDGGHSDNTGDFTVTATQLAPAAAPAVPEVSPFALLALGLGGLMLRARRKSA